MKIAHSIPGLAVAGVLLAGAAGLTEVRAQKFPVPNGPSMPTMGNGISPCCTERVMAPFPTTPSGIGASLVVKSQIDWTDPSKTKIRVCITAEVRSATAGQWTQPFTLRVTQQGGSPVLKSWQVPQAIAAGTVPLNPQSPWCVDQPLGAGAPALFLTTDPLPRVPVASWPTRGALPPPASSPN